VNQLIDRADVSSLSLDNDRNAGEPLFHRNAPVNQVTRARLTAGQLVSSTRTRPGLLHQSSRVMRSRATMSSRIPPRVLGTHGYELVHRGSRLQGPLDFNSV
jgi:hypothetical protein